MNADGLLWKVSKSGIAPSYLFGTFHTEDVNATPAGRAALEQLHHQRMVFFELGAGMKAEMQAALVTDTSLIIAQEPAPLFTWLSDTLAARLKAQTTALGLPAQALPAIKPGMLFAMISIPPCALRAAATMGAPMNDQVRQVAEAAGITGIGLENWRDQLGLFIDKPLAEQRSLLRLGLAANPDPEAAYSLTYRLYQQCRVQMIWEISMAIAEALIPGDKVISTGVKLWKDLIVERNHAMATRVTPALAEGGAMIVVGALHLPSKDGLVALISKLGYTVERVM